MSTAPEVGQPTFQEKDTYSSSLKDDKYVDNEEEDSSSTTKAKSSSEIYKSRGVARMEAVKSQMDNTSKGNHLRLTFCALLIICAWVSALDSSTSYSYAPYATSNFGHHSMLGTVEIAGSIISSVCRPMISKISDITSRPITYAIILVFYTLGHIVTASSSHISAYIIGTVFMSVGNSGILLLNDVITADITPLKYRGLMYGLLSSPYVINTWFTAKIVEALLNRGQWRWGYGMFAILMPVLMSPVIYGMHYLEEKAQKDELELRGEDRYVYHSVDMEGSGWMGFIWRHLEEADFIGLLLLGFGWSLLLLPFSLTNTAIGGYSNPSLIAMFVVGGVLLVVYSVYELWIAKYPSMSKKVLLNRTFMTAVCIDFFYQLGGMIRLLFFSSFVYVIFDWSYQNWVYFNNTLTMGLCFFGVVIGVIMRYTHRTKYLQCFGLALQVASMGITFWARNEHATTAAVVWTQILIGIGGACSVVGSQVNSQASVPHQETAMIISLLSLWSSIGQSIGSAVATAIWQNKLPVYMAKNLPSWNETTVLEYYNDIILVHELPYESVERKAIIKSYNDVLYYIFLASLILTIIPFLASFFQRNFYLGNSLNGVEEEAKEEQEKNNTTKGEVENSLQRVMRFLDEPFDRKKRHGISEA
ncbi:hypothetical protein WICPIJ_004284 [Wickerhamomyces pijperi]|uniref:Major facilitator superfamily (MFS) profile domain-containing protein n=1 Tax=Wickerhamomyces pijperi TaxID=599730 RepID=A0A9P8TM73_WICPI|nr:hypothetical protein WICPIJ_004284 [Wickerhamomyces pijperi]